MNITEHDVARWFTGTWVRNLNTGNIGKITGDVDGSNIIILTKTGNTIQREHIPLEAFSWEHCAYPNYGYRNVMFSRRRYVVYIQKIPARIAAKGLNSHNTSISFPQLYAVGNPDFTNIVIELNSVVAQALFDDTYPALTECVRVMTELRTCYGMALSSQWALTLGPEVSSSFILHYCGQIVGFGEDINAINCNIPEVDRAWKEFLTQAGEAA